MNIKIFVKALSFTESCVLFLYLYPCISITKCEALSESTNLKNVCSGDLVTFNCVVVGGGTTIWKGSAFPECGSNNRNEISLRHTQFNSDSESLPVGVCNNGAIAARAIGVDGDNYTSQLNMTVNAEMNNRTVECVYEYNFTTLVIFSYKLILEPEMSLNLSSIRAELFNVSKSELTFAWNLPTNGCSRLQYLIFANNCGVCPIQTELSHVTCKYFSVQNHTCTFTIGVASSNDTVVYGEQLNVSLNGMNLFLSQIFRL